MNNTQLLQFIQSVARQAPVSYEVHAQVDEAVKKLKEMAEPKKE